MHLASKRHSKWQGLKDQFSSRQQGLFPKPAGTVDTTFEAPPSLNLLSTTTSINLLQTLASMSST